MAHTVRFGIRCSQPGRTWAEIREWFQAAEAWGFESGFIFDHLVGLNAPHTDPTLEGWTLAGALADATSTIEIGPMVTGVTYRNPGLLMKCVTTVDHISNGRALLTIGAGWFEGEHKMYGYDFPRAGVRVSMVEEAIEIFKLLQSQSASSYDGEHFQLDGAIFEPKPVRNPMPLVIGGSQPRMLGIIARHADWWDNNFRELDEYLPRVQQLEEACQKIGRDPAEIRRSTTRSDRFLVDNDPDEIVEQLRAMREAGITDFLFHVPEDRSAMQRFAEEIMPELRREWAE